MTDMESFGEIKLKDEAKLKLVVKELIRVQHASEVETKLALLRRTYKIAPNKNQLRYIYETHYAHEPIPEFLQQFLIRKSMRSRSGVLVATIVLKPGVFSCPEKCAYCPTETDLDGNPTQPKSYISTEPAMLRALQYEFDVRGQLADRIQAYLRTGNIKLDTDRCFKFEIILSGGTWESYPYAYRDQVMNELYWAANTYLEPRTMTSLDEEITINETATFRIIGLTIETRPDYVTRRSIRDYRRWGVTRVQLGVQHYDDDILDLLQRDCPTHKTIEAIHLLKQTGFKVVCHLMPDLPGSSPEKDQWMFQQALTNPLLQFDDVKIYPTAVCQSSDPTRLVTSTISEWYKDGSYVPYSEHQFRTLMEILKEYKTNVQPWVRIQRLVRDIPSKSIEAGYHKYSNLRQMLTDEMKRDGQTCQCIRCMEVDDAKGTPVLVVRTYNASYGKEYFISYELYPDEWTWAYSCYVLRQFISTLFGYKRYWSGDSTRRAIVGFCRLRIDMLPGAGILPELERCGLIRELHVYGSSLGIGSHGSGTQHKGYGQKLMRVAEDIIASYDLPRVAVIAGVGVREYYKNKCGYALKGTYMVKSLSTKENSSDLLYLLMFVVLYVLFL